MNYREELLPYQPFPQFEMIRQGREDPRLMKSKGIREVSNQVKYLVLVKIKGPIYVTPAGRIM